MLDVVVQYQEFVCPVAQTSAGTNLSLTCADAVMDAAVTVLHLKAVVRTSIHEPCGIDGVCHHSELQVADVLALWASFSAIELNGS
ncbi:hypothetical protein EG329_006904 [Mollisiaceae sp. DMI_Dod_QoI]|nr:hypothetical protein EG329_006904 [Helotiales sp. DMI_Dod_QoI]